MIWFHTIKIQRYRTNGIIFTGLLKYDSISRWNGIRILDSHAALLTCVGRGTIHTHFVQRMEA